MSRDCTRKLELVSSKVSIALFKQESVTVLLSVVEANTFCFSSSRNLPLPVNKQDQPVSFL